MDLDCGDGQFFGWGMITMGGKTPAEKAVELINHWLGSLGVKEASDVIGTTADGARAIKVKCGLLPSLLRQLCFSHGYQPKGL